jgi:hypothetical protein
MLQGMRFRERGGSFSQLTKLLIKTRRQHWRPQAKAQTLELPGRVHGLIPRARIGGVTDSVAKLMDDFG